MALRTLLIGVGGRGIWPVRQWPARDDIDIVGLCDIRDEALAQAREHTGVDESACWHDWTQALQGTDCEAVVVITPPKEHYPMCLAAVRAGKHVLVEKPFATDLRQAIEVVNAADEAGVKLVVGQQARYSGANVAAMEFLASGRAGKAEAGFMTRFSKRANVHHSGQDKQSYGWERGVHDFDTAWSIFDSLPATVRAREFNPSWSPYRGGAGMYAIVEYRSGAVCSFNSSFMSHRGDNNFAVDCTLGSLEVGGRGAVYKPADGGDEEILQPGDTTGAETRVTNNWLAWIAGGPEPVQGMHHNLWILATVESVGASSDEGRAVDVEEYLNSRR